MYVNHLCLVFSFVTSIYHLILGSECGLCGQYKPECVEREMRMLRVHLPDQLQIYQAAVRTKGRLMFKVSAGTSSCFIYDLCCPQKYPELSRGVLQ